jgi:hypothetical protein
VVAPGRLYRSGLLDDRFVRYLRERLGVERIVSLSGPTPAHDTARALGMEVVVLDWPASHLPPRNELESLLRSLDHAGPTLIHCAGGSDRTGYVVAAWRVRRQGWPLDRAVAEMARFGHDPARDTRLQEELRAFLGDGGAVAAGPPVRTGSR